MTTMEQDKHVSVECQKVLDLLAQHDPGLTDFLHHPNATPVELDVIAEKAHRAYHDELGDLEIRHVREAVQVYADRMLKAMLKGAGPTPPPRLMS